MVGVKYIKQKSSNLAIWGGVFLLFAGLSVPLAHADTKPYFKVYGADIFAGGWFNNGSTACSTALGSNYQDSDTTGATDRNGGIVTFTKSSGSGNPLGGSSGQYGVFALGAIDGNFNSGNGFYSDSTKKGSVKADSLTFSNNNSDDFGGSFQWAKGTSPHTRAGNCIPDYYSPTTSGGKRDSTAKEFDASSIPGWYGASGQFWYKNIANDPTPLNLISAPLTVGAGQHFTVFVNGNVFIGSNITYANNSTPDTVPKFALVVNGSIYVGPGVTQLDGLYIAQPNPATANPMQADTGVFWTCHLNSTAPVDDALPNTCSQRLTVNGAVIAKQVQFMRSAGSDVPSATTTASENLSAQNSSETFNFTPEMIMGGPFFNPTPVTTLKIQSLISLPPIF